MKKQQGEEIACKFKEVPTNWLRRAWLPRTLCKYSQKIGNVPKVAKTETYNNIFISQSNSRADFLPRLSGTH